MPLYARLQWQCSCMQADHAATKGCACVQKLLVGYTTSAQAMITLSHQSSIKHSLVTPTRGTLIVPLSGCCFYGCAVCADVNAPRKTEVCLTFYPFIVAQPLVIYSLRISCQEPALCRIFFSNEHEHVSVKATSCSSIAVDQIKEVNNVIT